MTWIKWLISPDALEMHVFWIRMINPRALCVVLRRHERPLESRGTQELMNLRAQHRNEDVCVFVHVSLLFVMCFCSVSWCLFDALTWVFTSAWARIDRDVYLRRRCRTGRTFDCHERYKIIIFAWMAVHWFKLIL